MLPFSESDEASDAAYQRQLAEKREERRQRERLEQRKAIKHSPPGINMFQEKDFLGGFVAADLSLEEDFGYNGEKRARLKRLGLLDEDVDAAFSDPHAFIMFLAPEASSALVANQDDFARICDYLFFFVSSCQDDLLAAVYKKALFSMLKNYAYK